MVGGSDSLIVRTLTVRGKTVNCRSIDSLNESRDGRLTLTLTKAFVVTIAGAAGSRGLVGPSGAAGAVGAPGPAFIGYSVGIGTATPPGTTMYCEIVDANNHLSVYARSNSFPITASPGATNFASNAIDAISFAN